MSNPNLETILRRLGAPIFTAGHREFELSVATSNFLYRYHRPKYVVRPRNGEDVATTVRLANQFSEKITIKNGGHSYAGFSNATGGILLDLSNMKSIQIENTSSGKYMIMSGGALWGDAYHELVIGTPHMNGWIVNGGRCPLVGVSGFLLGGGFGPFSRSVGMGMDQLVEVDVVTAEGDTITIGEKDDRNSDKGKLFWALRGCGGGNFGVVTRLKIKVEPLRDENVVAGRLIWNVFKENLEEFREMMVAFYTAKWEEYITIDTTWECNLSSSSAQRPFQTRFITYYDGSEEKFQAEIKDKLQAGTEGTGDTYRSNFKDQLVRRALAETSSMFLHETLWAQWSEETRRSLPTDRAYTLYSSWVIKNDNAENVKKITEIITERIERFRTKFTGERGTFGVTWIHIGGKISTKGPKDTPYPWRQGNYCIYILVRWHEKWLVKEMGEFFDECKDKLKPCAIDAKASYVNFPDRNLNGWAQAYYGENLSELQEIHKLWNPKKRPVFSFVQGIEQADRGLLQPGVGGGTAGDDSRRLVGDGSRGRLGDGFDFEPAPVVGQPSADPVVHQPSADDAQNTWNDSWKSFDPPDAEHSYPSFVAGGENIAMC